MSLRSPSKPAIRPIQGILLGLVILLGVLLYYQTHLSHPFGQKGPRLPKFSSVGSFALTDSAGKPFSSDALAGKIWVAQFFFTDCGGPCPSVTAKLIELQGMLGDAQNVRIVAISIDPENDTPKKLRAYATVHHADPDRWIFLTAHALAGGPAVIHDLVIGRFFVGFQPNTAPGTTSGSRIVHSTKVALVDATGKIRAYHDGLDEETPKLLLTDIATLMQEEKIQ